MRYIIFFVLFAIAVYAVWRWLDRYVTRSMEMAVELGRSNGTPAEYG